MLPRTFLTQFIPVRVAEAMHRAQASIWRPLPGECRVEQTAPSLAFKTVKEIRPADFKRQLGAVKHDARQLHELCDEAPAAYRDIREVMQAQRDLVRQSARLTPVLNFKHPDRRVE